MMPWPKAGACPVRASIRTIDILQRRIRPESTAQWYKRCGTQCRGPGWMRAATMQQPRAWLFRGRTSEIAVPFCWHAIFAAQLPGRSHHRPACVWPAKAPLASSPARPALAGQLGKHTVCVHSTWSLCRLLEPSRGRPGGPTPCLTSHLLLQDGASSSGALKEAHDLERSDTAVTGCGTSTPRRSRPGGEQPSLAGCSGCRSFWKTPSLTRQSGRHQSRMPPMSQSTFSQCAPPRPD